MQTATFSNPDTNFIGTLVKYEPGPHYVQMVFENDQETKLSVSQNEELIQMLNLGDTYQISGPEMIVGSKSFIYEPNAIPFSEEAVEEEKKKHSKIFWVIISIVVGLMSITTGVLAAVVTDNSGEDSQASQTQVPQVQGANDQKVEDKTFNSTAGEPENGGSSSGGRSSASSTSTNTSTNTTQSHSTTTTTKKKSSSSSNSSTNNNTTPQEPVQQPEPPAPEPPAPETPPETPPPTE